MTFASPFMVRIPCLKSHTAWRCFNFGISLIWLLVCAAASRKATPLVKNRCASFGFSRTKRSPAVLATRTALAGGRTGCCARQRLVHDPADGASAASALSAATEATVNLTGGARRLISVQRRAHIRVAEHVTRTDDHGKQAR